MAVLKTRVYRATNSNNFANASLLVTTLAGSSSYADNTVTYGNTYYYWLQHEYYDSEVGEVVGPYSVYITPPTPTLSNVNTAGDTDPLKPLVTGWTWAYFDTGNNVESVQWRYRINSGAWSSWANINTISNGGPYETDHIEGDPTPGDLVDFELVPYSGNSGGGTAGSTYQIQGTVGEAGA